MKRSIFVLFLGILIAASFWSKPTACPDFLPHNPRLPASLFGFGASQCEAVFKTEEGVFDVAKFEARVRELEKTSGPTDQEIQTAMGKPEEFLAVVESLAKVRELKLQSFSERLSELSDKDLRKIYQTIFKSTQDGKITDYDLDNLLVTLYRRTYRPKGLVKSSLETKSLQQAFDRIDDKKIKERLALSLYRDGMIEAFDLVIKEPNLRTKFLSLLAKSKSWIDITFATGLWTSTVALQMATQTPMMELNSALLMLPPYLPSLKQFTEVMISESDKAIFVNKGPEAGYENLNQKYKGILKKGRHWQYFRNTYLWTFSVLITTSISMAVYERVQTEQQAQQRSEYQQTDQLVNDYLETSKLTPEQRGEADFKRFVAYCEANGLKVDVNSPEMQEERKKRIAAYVEAAKQSK